MKTLSPAQKEIINYLFSGGKVYWVDGYDAHCFRQDHKRVSSATILKLETLGYIHKINEQFNGWEYALTNITEDDDL
jgi:hypothetical protein